jgi:hypothetical protein
MRLRRARRERDAGQKTSCRQEKRKDAGSAQRRGSNKERRMPARQNGFANGQDGSRNSYSDEDDCDGGYRNRRGRMHDDAQRAVVGGSFNRVNVRHLDDSQQREQEQTQKDDRARCARFWAATPAVLESKCCQKAAPCSKDTQFRRARAARRYLTGAFSAVYGPTERSQIRLKCDL